MSGYPGMNSVQLEKYLSMITDVEMIREAGRGGYTGDEEGGALDFDFDVEFRVGRLRRARHP